MAPRRKISLRQLDILLDFVEQNLDITMGRHPPSPGYLGVERARSLWDTVATALNSVADGATKSGEQWKRYWIEYKAKIRAKAKAADSRSHQFGDELRQYTPLEPIEKRLLALVRSVAAEGMPTVHITNVESLEPKPKKLRQDNFTIVKKCCVNLVKKHGRSVTLFDDLAFRELIDLIPMTQSEKQILTSRYIQTLLDDDQLADEATRTMDNTTDDIAADDNEGTPLPLQAIKEEVEVIPCTCGKNTDENMSRHTVECPASSQQSCWNFFEVSLDSATCQICYEMLTWTDIATLREHLQINHPTVEFVDDGDEFQKEGSEDGSTNEYDMEEVYLDETILESEQTASAAKRRKKRAKAALNITGPITRENIVASLQRFKSLDSFGQYVASLMKLIPKDKCIELQIEMVQRLLHEQAAAG